MLFAIENVYFHIKNILLKIWLELIENDIHCSFYLCQFLQMLRKQKGGSC